MTLKRSSNGSSWAATLESLNYGSWTTPSKWEYNLQYDSAPLLDVVIGRLLLNTLEPQFPRKMHQIDKYQARMNPKLPDQRI